MKSPVQSSEVLTHLYDNVHMVVFVVVTSIVIPVLAYMFLWTFYSGIGLILLGQNDTFGYML